VVGLPVWIASWVYECCGQVRRTGEIAELQLTFRGDVAAAAGLDSIHVLDDGRVRIVGTVVGRVSDADAHTAGTLIASGGVQFAIEGNAPAAKVRCVGELWEDRHGWPTGATTGRLIGIRWRPAILREVNEQSFAIDGYGPGRELSRTENWPRQDPDS
jgi:hypothetical protein